MTLVSNLLGKCERALTNLMSGIDPCIFCPDFPLFGVDDFAVPKAATTAVTISVRLLFCLGDLERARDLRLRLEMCECERLRDLFRLLDLLRLCLLREYFLRFLCLWWLFFLCLSLLLRIRYDNGERFPRERFVGEFGEGGRSGGEACHLSLIIEGEVSVPETLYIL